MRERGIRFRSEATVPVVYKGVHIETSLRCDFIIEDVLCVEIKAVESIRPIHIAQLMTYMKLLKSPKGVLLNFNVTNLYSEGQQTFVNKYFEEL